MATVDGNWIYSSLSRVNPFMTRGHRAQPGDIVDTGQLILRANLSDLDNGHTSTSSSEHWRWPRTSFPWLVRSYLCLLNRLYLGCILTSTVDGTRVSLMRSSSSLWLFVSHSLVRPLVKLLVKQLHLVYECVCVEVSCCEYGCWLLLEKRRRRLPVLPGNGWCRLLPFDCSSASSSMVHFLLTTANLPFSSSRWGERALTVALTF